MRNRIADVTSGFPWLVYEQNGIVVGFSYATKWKSRSAFRHSVESSVYVSNRCTGQGIGTPLYSALISRLRQLNIHSVIGGIALPNPPSIKIHEQLGFEKVAHFKQVGRKFETWIDTGYWQLVLSDTETCRPPKLSVNSQTEQDEGCVLEAHV